MQDHSRWSKYYSGGGDFHLTTDSSLSFILKKAQPPQRNFAIDLGSGTGQLTRELFHRGFKKVSGVDISEVGVKRAQEATIFSELEYSVYNLEKNFESLFAQKADLVTTKYVLAFIEDRANFLQRVVSLLSDDGVFVVISPSRKFQPEEKVGITLSIEEINGVLKKYFSSALHYEHARDDIFICRN